VEKDGTYQKGRRITRPVTHVAADVSAPRHPDAPRPRGREPSSGGIFVSRTTSWFLAVLVVALVLALAYIGTAFLAREGQFEHVKERQKEVERELERAGVRHQALERRLVELETQLENVKERGK